MKNSTPFLLIIIVVEFFAALFIMTYMADECCKSRGYGSWSSNGCYNAKIEYENK